MKPDKTFLAVQKTDDDSCFLIKQTKNGEFTAAKIAILKQDCLGDLWIGSRKDKPEDLILSTQMRIGPIALISTLKADFYIIKYEGQEDTDFFKKETPITKEEIAATKLGRIENFKAHLKTNSPRLHPSYSIEAGSVNWSEYDVIISINSCVPKSIRTKHTSPLWACMPGEGNVFTPDVSRLDYDCFLNHNWAYSSRPQGIALDFPYTFIEYSQFEKLFSIKDFAKRNGIYLEINSCSHTVRPPSISGVEEAPALRRMVCQELKIHRNTIDSHLEDLSTALAFVKLGGRTIRGNSISEAIASGLPVLIREKDCPDGLKLSPDNYFKTTEELAEKINLLSEDQEYWEYVQKKQQQLLQLHGITMPLKQICYAYNKKNDISWKTKKWLHLIQHSKIKPAWAKILRGSKSITKLILKSITGQ